MKRTPSPAEQAKERARDDLTLTELSNMLLDLDGVHEVLRDHEDTDFVPTIFTVGVDPERYTTPETVAIIMRRQGWRFHGVVWGPYHRIEFILPEGKPVSDGGQCTDGAVWDGEDCPRDRCDGGLVQCDAINVMCRACEEVWTHVRTEIHHKLQTAEFEIVTEKPIAMTDGGQCAGGTEQVTLDGGGSA